MVLDEYILDLIIAIVAALALVIILLAAVKRKVVRKYIPVYIASVIASIFQYLKIYDGLFRTISQLVYSMMVLLMAISLIIEEYRLLKRLRAKKQHGFIPALIMIYPIFQLPYDLLSTLTTIWIIIGIILSCVAFHVFHHERTNFHLFIFIITLISTVTALAAHFDYLGFSWAYEVSYAMFFFSTLLQFIIALIAILEYRIIESEKKYRASYTMVSFYKDIFTHDISNIIQNLQFSFRILLKESTVNSSKGKKYKDRIDENIERASSLIRNIRNLSQLASESMILKRVNLLDAIDDAIAFTRRNIQEKQLSIEYTRPEKDIFVLANELLVDVIENILINGGKHNANNHVQLKILIDQGKSSKFCRISIIDNGLGIPDDVKPELFSVNRNNHEAPTTGGLGIGLMITRQAIEMFNGRITVKNRLKDDYTKGSIFILEIPCS